MMLKNAKGFTLIELLVVIAIIGILAAIAIPQFSSYRASAYCTRVESDVANAMVAGEGWYAQKGAYPAGAATLANGGFTPSDQVSVTYSGAGTEASPFVVTGTDGTGTCPKGGTYTFTQGSAPSWGS